MNRQTKRMLQRQGQLGADGESPAGPKKATGANGAGGPGKRPPVARGSAGGGSTRPNPAQFLREVRGELRRVAWPTRAEVVNYSSIVLLTLALVMGVIFCLDYLFAKSVFFLFETK